MVKKIGTGNLMMTTRLDIDKLESIERQLKKHFVVQVGVLGAKSRNRKETVTNKSGKHVKGKSASAKTNAEIGLIHEKGSLSLGIPRRSFLEMPIVQRLPKVLNQIGQKMIDAMNKENIKKIYTDLALISEGIVLKAFSTRGYGQWAPNSPSTVARKGSSMPLIDTGQLRKSISSRVVSK